MIPEFSTKRVIFSFSIFCLVLLSIHAYVLIDLSIEPFIAFTDAAVSMILFLIISVILFFTLKYYQPSSTNFFYLRLWAILLAIGSTYLGIQILQYRYAGHAVYLNFLNQSLTIRFLFQVLLSGMVSLLLWLINYHTEEQSLKAREQELVKAAKDAELYNLRQQLQPHFLFNSLNSISALAGSKPEQARTMIQQLSEFLRHTLKKDDTQLVSLKEELKQLNLYLEIEKVRFGHRLQFELNYNAKCENMQLPALILQPLVENAIKFGLYDTLENVLIKIETDCLADESLFIEISNPFDAHVTTNAQGTGFGLASVQRRLYLLYARNDLVETKIEQQLFKAKLTIPQKYE